MLNTISCTSAQDSISTSCAQYVAKIKLTEQYRKDSTFLIFTVDRWIDSSYGWFSHYNHRNAPKGFYKIHIGDIFYNYSKLKLTAFTYVEYSTDYIDTLYERPDNMAAHLFDSHTVMGFRDSLNQPWKLFELDEIFKGIRGGSLKSAENFHESIFLNKKEMSERKVIVYNEKSGLNTNYESVKYLPCEDYFWTDSPLWKIGQRVPGHYIFETFMNSTPIKRDLRPVCKINYPDSLLRLYWQ